MNTVQTAGVLFIVGSAVFLFGAGIGVPGYLPSQIHTLACVCSKSAPFCGGSRSRSTVSGQSSPGRAPDTSS